MTLDLFAGIAARDQAMADHEAKRGDLLQRCRTHLALLHQREGRPVSADDARLWLEANGGMPKGVNAWMGSLFKGGEWVPVGWKQSEHPANNARWLRTWRLKHFGEKAA